MAGIFPDGGVPANRAYNAVEVPTVNCAAQLFYGYAQCEPRFEPSAYNALVSEILNAVASGGNEYDCSKLNNLALAIARLGGITLAEVDNTIQPGRMVRSSDGDVLFNCTSADVVPGDASDITTEGLLALGLCPAHGLLSQSADDGVDSFSNPVSTGDVVFNSPDGRNVNLNLEATVEVATAGGVDSFGNTILPGQAVITFGSGETLVSGAGSSVGVATLDSVGTVELADKAEASSGQGTGSVGPLVITPEVLKTLDDFVGQLNSQEDKVFMYDASEGKMQWIKMSELPGGGLYDYKAYRPNGIARRSKSGSGVAVVSGRSLPWTMPVNGVIKVNMTGVSKAGSGDPTVTNSLTSWYNVNQGDVIAFTETGPGQQITITRNGAGIMSLFAYSGTVNFSQSGQKTGSWSIAPQGTDIDTNAPDHFTNVSGSASAYYFSVELFAST